MSPSKLKSNERQAARDRKAMGRQAASGGMGASAYNPSSGTFHTLEPLNSDTGAGCMNGRFKSIDDTDDTASLNGGADAECLSNNGSSYSGESEDQLHMNAKDKNGSGKPGTGCADKRNKIQGKNERKHQRQKERRAQELRDKCTGYLMSRKLEALAQKLVAMGFSQERATMALIVNDGHVEQSVAWLLEGGEGHVHEDWNTGGNPEIDITEELGQILEIEKKYSFARPDIERAVVACEGDLVKALECLFARTQSMPSLHDEGHNVESRSHVSTEEPSASLPTMLCSPAATQLKSNAVLQPHQKDTAAVLCSEGRLLHVSSLLESYVSPDEACKPYTHVRRYVNPLTAPHSSVQGTFPSASLKNSPLVSPFLSTSNVESGLVFGFGTPDPRLISIPSKDHAQNRPVKEPTYMEQMHSHASSQPIVAPNNHSVPSPAFSPSRWSQAFLEGGSPSSVLYVNAPHGGDMGWKGMNACGNPMKSLELGLSRQCNPFVSMQASSGVSQWKGLRKGVANEIPSSHSLNTTAHSGSPPGTSNGLFTGWGAALSQSSVDWSSGPIPNCDYRNIDWSMNAWPTAVQRLPSQLSSLMLQEKGSHRWSRKEERRLQTGSRAASSTDLYNEQSVWSTSPSGAGIQDNIPIESLNANAHEWTSPFTGKALFSLPQAVSSPSL